MDAENNPQLEIVVQRWPDIDLPEATTVLAALTGTVHASSIVAHSARPTASSSLVRSDHGTIFVKRYARSVRDVETIAPYHRFAAYLTDRGISTPRFLHFASDNAQGLHVDPRSDTVAVIGDMAYEAYPVASGEDRYTKALSWDPPKTLDEARKLGAFVAAMNRVSVGFDEAALKANGMTNRFGLFAQHDVDAALETWLAQRPAVTAYLTMSGRDLTRDAQVVQPYASRIASRYSALPSSWTHGDPHISNFLWSGTGPTAVFDFGLSDRNTALFDLAMLLERHSIQWLDVMDGHEEACRPDVAKALIEGYCSVRPLSDDEKAILPDMLAISQAEAGLNWIGYYMNGTHRHSDADWCYDTCFLGHTRWFSTNPGRALLDSIREYLV